MNVKALLLALTAIILVGTAGYAYTRNQASKQIPEQTLTTQFSPKATEELVVFESGAKIEMAEDGLTPQTVRVKKGATVTFINEGLKEHWPASDVHPTHANYPGFDPKKPLSPKQSWTFTFDQVGSWNYHDHLNPAIKGVVTVLE